MNLCNLAATFLIGVLIGFAISWCYFFVLAGSLERLVEQQHKEITRLELEKKMREMK